MRKNKKNIFLLLLLFFFLPKFVFSQSEILIFPQVIQDKAKVRDVLEYKIKIKNLGDKLYHFYTLVKDIGESENLDKSTSLSKWVEIFRGRMEILPGEEREISLTIKVPFYAKAGNYFSEIIFAQGSTESDAIEREKMYKMPKVLLNIEVEESTFEKIQVKKFKTEKGFYLNPNVKFEIELENIGNKELEPEGKILIYDRKGKEIGFLELEKKKIAPNEIKNYEIFEKVNGNGQFKAVLFGEYGKNKEKIFQDTTFFWVINWQFPVLFLLLLLILSSIFALILLKNLKRSFEIARVKRKIFDIFKK